MLTTLLCLSADFILLLQRDDSSAPKSFGAEDGILVGFFLAGLVNHGGFKVGGLPRFWVA